MRNSEDVNKNIDELDDKCKDNDRGKKKSKSLKWYEHKKLKHVEILDGPENIQERKLDKIDKFKK